MYIERRGTGDHPGRPEQAFQRVADVTWETVWPLDEEDAGRRVDDDQDLARHPGQAPCPGRIRR